MYPHYEYKIMDQMEEWASKAVDYELDAAAAVVHLEYIKKTTKEANEAVRALEEDKEKKRLTDAEFQLRIDEINNQLREATQRKKELLKKQEEQKINEARGEVLMDMVEDIRKDRVLKQISFWQGVINYLLYFVFIFNAFITGLGLFGTTSATGSTSVSSVAAVEASTPS